MLERIRLKVKMREIGNTKSECESDLECDNNCNGN